MSEPQQPAAGGARPPDVKKSTASASGGPDDFDRLVADVLENPDRLLGDDITDEKVLEIQRRLNPYSGVAAAARPLESGRKRVAAVSCTNLREDYLRRFLATSLVGFLFQIYHEWEVPVEARRWTPPKAATKAGDPATQPLDAAKLVERLESLLGIAREAQAAAAEAKALAGEVARLEDEAKVDEFAPGAASDANQKEPKKAAASKPASGAADALPAKRAALASLEAKHAGLLYAATHTLSRAGADASARLRATAEAGLGHPEVREILGRHPLPAPPGQVEIPPAVAKEVIGGFLRHWLEFDPSVHVRAGHDAKAVAAAAEQARLGVGSREVAVDGADPRRLPLEEVRRPPPEPAPEHAAALAVIRQRAGRRDAVLELLRSEDLAVAALSVAQDAAIMATPETRGAVAGLLRDGALADAFVRFGGPKVTDSRGDLAAGALEAFRKNPPLAAAARRVLRDRAVGASARARAALAELLESEPFADAAVVALASAEARRAFFHYLGPVAPGDPARPAADRVPPQDTFHRWAYYTEVNYAALRTVTEALYPERPDLDWTLALWDVFEGPAAEVDAAFDRFCERYSEELPCSVKGVEFGGWTLLADFTENRRDIKFYNKNTEVLKRIMDRHAEDRRLGADLMRKRVVATKAANIAADGADAPGLARYKQNLGARAAAGRGAEKVITAEQMRRLERARGNVKAAQELELLEQHEKTIEALGPREARGELTPEEARDLAAARADLPRVHEMLAVPDNAIQVDVFESNPARGEFKKTHFYTQAEAPDHLRDDGRGDAKGSDHPAAAASAAAARAAAASRGAPAAAEGQRLAPFAVEHILRAAEAERGDAERKAEALQDAMRSAARAADAAAAFGGAPDV